MTSRAPATGRPQPASLKSASDLSETDTPPTTASRITVRRRSWMLAVLGLLSTMASGPIPSTSMTWPGSQSTCAEVAVTVAVNTDQHAGDDLLDYQITAGHNHGPPTTIDGPRSTLHTYYVVAGSTPVLVHNCGDGIEEMGSGNSWTEDLSNVTGNTASSRNRAISAIISEDFPNLRFTHQPVYSPWINTGIAKAGSGTQIGFKPFASRTELRRTLIHEELHHRWFARGLQDHHPRDGSGLSDRFYKIVDRYMSIRGW